MGNRKSQACAFYALGVLQSGEGLEYLLPFLCGHTFARVGYVQGEQISILVFYDIVSISLLSDGHADHDAAFIGIFDGIADEVVEYLTNAESIGEKEYICTLCVSSFSLFLLLLFV